MWDRRQRAVLAGLTAALLVGLAVRRWANPARVPAEQPPDGPRAEELPQRVDPNTADWPALAAIPVLSKSLAQRIIEDRETFRAKNPGRLPFRTCQDLQRIKGIGPATTQSLEPYLAFPSGPADKAR